MKKYGRTLLVFLIGLFLAWLGIKNFFGGNLLLTILLMSIGVILTLVGAFKLLHDFLV